MWEKEIIWLRINGTELFILNQLDNSRVREIKNKLQRELIWVGG